MPGFLDDPIHISITGKLRKAPQISELKPDPKQKKRGNLLLLMYYLRSNIYNNRKLLLGDQKPVLVKKQFSQQQLTTQGKGVGIPVFTKRHYRHNRSCKTPVLQISLSSNPRSPDLPLLSYISLSSHHYYSLLLLS